MKGSLISMAAAAGAVRKADVTLNGDLLVAAWIDHEEPDGRGLGPKELARKIRTGELDVNGVIVGEGPFDRLAIAQGGAAVFRISASGRKGAPHTSTCFLKSNPILWSSLIVEELYRMDQELESKEWHHLIPQRPSIQLGILRAGDFYNRLPGSVEIVGTVRWDPQENFKDVRTRLEGRLAQLEERIRSTLDHEIEMRLELDLSRDSSEIDCENPLVRAVQSAIAKTVGHPIPLAGWRVVSDQPFFVHEAGIPAIYFGPFTDDDMTAHSDCESVSIERLVLMAQVYAASALLYCGFTA